VDKGFQEYVIKVGRVAKVVKGGRRFRFNALVVVGDSNGQVGIALGKSKEVSEAIKKAVEKAKKEMFKVPITKDGSIPHIVQVKQGSGIVLLKPAQPGTGVIAGNTARYILEACGIKNIVTKSIGSNNPFNLANAVIKALKLLKSKEEIFEGRGLVQWLLK